MKILIHSNAPWVPSGYGTQTLLLSERLVKAGHDVAISAFFGLQGATLEWNDMVIYPGGAQPYGSDVLLQHAKHFFDNDRGVILTLLDEWVLHSPGLEGEPIASWIPLDHHQLPDAVTEYLKNSDALPIAMSRFGEGQLKANGFDPCYVPHMIDTDVFKPLDREQCRKELHFDGDEFIIGMVAANQGLPSRKCFPEAFLAVSRFIERYPTEKIVFFLHTDTDGLRGHGINLPRLAEQCGIPNNRIVEVNQYLYKTGLLSANYLTRAMNCMDVLLNPSMGEGFGLTIVESQACGTPVIATNTSAMPEVTGAGWLVEGQEFYTGLGTWQTLPNVDELVDCLQSAYQRADGLREQATSFAQQYDVETVYENHWKPTIDEVSERMRSKQILELAPMV